jgi:hypothetical protein
MTFLSLWLQVRAVSKDDAAFLDGKTATGKARHRACNPIATLHLQPATRARGKKKRCPTEIGQRSPAARGLSRSYRTRG